MNSTVRIVTGVLGVVVMLGMLWGEANAQAAVPPIVCKASGLFAPADAAAKTACACDYYYCIPYGTNFWFAQPYTCPGGTEFFSSTFTCAATTVAPPA